MANREIPPPSSAARRSGVSPAPQDVGAGVSSRIGEAAGSEAGRAPGEPQGATRFGMEPAE